MARARSQVQTIDEPTHQDEIGYSSASADWRRMTDVAHEHIARRAYQLYEERGCEPGHDLDDWLAAEHDIEQRHSAG